jgi:cephalosporin-C deacetylase
MLLGQPREVLETYKPPLTKAADFDQFWSETLTEYLLDDPKPILDKVATPISEIEIFDVTIPGFNQDPIKGWFLTPKNLSAPQPVIVLFEGYGGGRGNYNEWLFWANCGYPTLVMDTRGQGGGHRRGDTPDGAYPRGSSSSGFMTMGIQSKEDYYYRRVYSDSVAFVRAAKHLPNVDSTRIVTTGGSQGGAIALAAASLAPEVFATMPDVPFMSHIHRAIEITDAYPYQEIVNYCRIHRTDSEPALHTLTYFDCMNLVTMAKAQALISLGMHDPICPPDTIFAMRNHYAGKVDMQIWDFNMHEGGSSDQNLVQAEWLADALSSAQG